MGKHRFAAVFAAGGGVIAEELQAVEADHLELAAERFEARVEAEEGGVDHHQPVVHLVAGDGGVHHPGLRGEVHQDGRQIGRRVLAENKHVGLRGNRFGHEVCGAS